MITAKQFIKKVQFDPNEKEANYQLVYLNFNSEVYVELDEILSMDGNFMTVFQNSKRAEIPMHRIRKFLKNEEVVWERK